MNPRPFILFILALLLATPSVPALRAAPADLNEKVELQLPAGDINSVLDLYEKFSGKTIIREANITPLNIRIVVADSIPKSEGMRLLESVLLLNGYALVPGDDNSVKVIKAAAAKNPRSEGVAIYANLSDLPKGDQIVTYFMQFQNITPQEAGPIFQSQIPPHPWGIFIPVPNAQALLITENASTIRQMARIKELIDVPSAKLVSRFITLQRADAERVAEVINKLIEARKAKSQTGASSGTAQSAGGDAANPAGTGSSDPNERNLVAGDVQLVPDARTNRILVVTRPVNFEYIKGLITEFDQAMVLTAPLERPLKYVTASEVLPVLETMLAEDKDPASGATPQPTINSVANPPGNLGNGNFSQNSESSTHKISNDRTLEEKQVTAPQAVMVGKTRLMADNQANSIIVIGPPESVIKVQAILDSLDKKPMQVYLSTVIGQLTLNDSSELAVDILHKYTKFGDYGSAGISRTRTDPIVDPSTLTTVASFAAIPAGLTLYGAIGSALDYYVKALASTNRFKLISRPVIYTANNKGALIASGQKIAVPSSSLTSLDNGALNSGSVVSNIEYTDVELRLEVVPQINANREVTLRIKQTNDSVVGSTVISGNTIPTIGTQVVNTTITVPNKSTIVLGGLITEDNNTNVNGVPVLKDIPVLGYLFKGTTKSKNRTELIILIQPVVIESDEELKDASQTEVDRNKFGPESKAFSDNVPFVPLKKNTLTPTQSTPASNSKTPRGLSPAAPVNTPKTTPISPTNGQLYP